MTEPYFPIPSQPAPSQLAAPPPEAPQPLSPLIRWAAGALLGAILLAVLILGQAFLKPLVCALLLTSLVAAGVTRLTALSFAGRHMPQGLATLMVMILVILGAVGIFSALSAQINDAMMRVPAIVERAQTALYRLSALLSDDLAQGLADAFRDINVTAWLRLAAGSAGNLLMTLVLILTYTGFLLAERHWLPGKIRLMVTTDSRRQKFNEIALSIRHSVHLYLVLKTVISAITGFAVYIICLIFGMEFAPLMGTMTFFLNFIPNFGSVIATVLVVIFALIEFGTLFSALMVLATVGLLQFVLGNIVDPMITGRGLQMSTFAIVVSLFFWSAIWGVAGTFLAVPMMVVVMIICTHVSGLRQVAIMLSKTGELPE